MRSLRFLLLATALLPVGTALASERGRVIRGGDLYAEPFIDAAKIGPLAAEQPVVIVARRGGWLSVETAGKRGWVRLLIVRLEGAAPGSGTAISSLRTGSTGRTVTTGVKGLEEGSIQNAAIDRAQQAQLDSFAASEDDARSQASEGKLQEAKLAKLKPGKGK